MNYIMESLNLSGLLFLTNMLFAVKITADRVEKMEFGACKQGEDDAKFTKSSLDQCIQNCRFKNDCESLSFHRTSLLCRLHRENSTLYSCKDPAIIYSAKRTGSFETRAECAKCHRYQTCTYNNGTNEYQCFYTECKPLGGKNLGNIHTVGSYVHSVCNEGYYNAKGKSYRMCQSNGEWSGTEPMCCPNGWRYFENSCYKYENGTALTFEDALVHCQQLHEGSNLLFIESDSENHFIRDTLEASESIVTVPRWQFFWNRIRRVGGKWTIVGENKTVPWSNWLPTEPNNLHNGENCGSVLFSPQWLLWGWNDIACSQTLAPICELKRN